MNAQQTREAHNKINKAILELKEEFDSKGSALIILGAKDLGDSDLLNATAIGMSGIESAVRLTHLLIKHEDALKNLMILTAAATDYLNQTKHGNKTDLSSLLKSYAKKY